MKYIVLSILFASLTLSARAQERAHEYDSGVRVPLEESAHEARPSEVIVVIGRRPREIPPAYERHVGEDPRSVEYDNAFSNEVVIYRYQFWGSREGMALNLRNTTREDPHDVTRGIPIDVGRSGELVICRFPPWRCFRVE